MVVRQRSVRVWQRLGTYTSLAGIKRVSTPGAAGNSEKLRLEYKLADGAKIRWFDGAANPGSVTFQGPRGGSFEAAWLTAAKRLYHANTILGTRPLEPVAVASAAA